MGAARISSPSAAHQDAVQAALALVNAFGDGAKDRLWEKGNVVELQAAVVHGKQEVLKVTQETVVTVAERERTWRMDECTSVEWHEFGAETEEAEGAADGA